MRTPPTQVPEPRNDTLIGHLSPGLATLAAISTVDMRAQQMQILTITIWMGTIGRQQIFLLSIGLKFRRLEVCGSAVKPIVNRRNLSVTV